MNKKIYLGRTVADDRILPPDTILFHIDPSRSVSRRSDLSYEDVDLVTTNATYVVDGSSKTRRMLTSADIRWLCNAFFSAHIRDLPHHPSYAYAASAALFSGFAKAIVLVFVETFCVTKREWGEQ